MSKAEHSIVAGDGQRKTRTEQTQIRQEMLKKQTLIPSWCIHICRHVCNPVLLHLGVRLEHVSQVREEGRSEYTLGGSEVSPALLSGRATASWLCLLWGKCVLCSDLLLECGGGVGGLSQSASQAWPCGWVMHKQGQAGVRSGIRMGGRRG